VIVKMLLENGAEVNAEGGKYGNALHAASFQGHKAIVKLLLEKGVEVNVAAMEGVSNPTVMKLLMVAKL
jgi:ankyrin repeat protein